MVVVSYVSKTGRTLDSKELKINACDIDIFRVYNTLLKEQQKGALTKKRCEYYEHINKLAEYANAKKETLFFTDDRVLIESLTENLLGRTVKNIGEISTAESFEWKLLGSEIKRTKLEIEAIVRKNREHEKMIKDREKQILLQQKANLAVKQYRTCEHVNRIIKRANTNMGVLVVEGDREKLDKLSYQLYDKTFNKINKIKTLDSVEWKLIEDTIVRYQQEMEEIIGVNRRIQDYYESAEFLDIKKACAVLMNAQSEFNEYIKEKLRSISQLFGTRIVRNKTINDDVYNYVRPYEKEITPFTAEVSSSVFTSAENKPMEYVVKCFYPDQRCYQKQVQDLYHLVEEIETLRDARSIIENYKLEYKQHLGNVPSFVMEKDERGFYSRLGFATIDERALTVQYRFSYTSGGGLAQRSFTVPMTEENIAKLINILEGKLTASAFAKEQRTLMTRKLREFIKKRDNFTCCNCGNSTYIEPNLLLEIDHIIPVAKGGQTVEDNLQTLCWKCNRAKSDKILE